MDDPNAMLGVLVLGLAWGVLKASRVAVAIWFGLRYPNAGRKIVRAYEELPVKCTMIGAVDVVLTLLISIALLKAEVLVLLGLLMLALLVVVMVLAYGPAYYLLGRRLVVGDNTRARVHTLLWGGLLAESVFWAPILGQVLSVATMLRGVGAISLALLAGRSSSAAPEAEE